MKMLLSSLVVLQLEVISYCYDYNQLIHSNDKNISDVNQYCLDGVLIQGLFPVFVSSKEIYFALYVGHFTWKI